MTDNFVTVVTDTQLQFYRGNQANGTISNFGQFSLDGFPLLAPDRAAMLTLNIVGFLSQGGNVVEATPVRKPPARALPPSDNTATDVLGALQGQLEGLTHGELMELFPGLSGKRLSNRLLNLKRSGRVTLRGDHWIFRSKKKRGRYSPSTSESSGIRPSGHGRTITVRTLDTWRYVRDHPGITRQEMVRAGLGTEDQVYGALKRNDLLFEVRGDQVFPGVWEGPPDEQPSEEQFAE
jgi:hypothetical protein